MGEISCAGGACEVDFDPDAGKFVMRVAGD